MAPQSQARKRAQLSLLVQKLLDGRDNVSPFTLIIDSLEQSSKPLLAEYIRRAQISKTKVVFVSYETLPVPKDIDTCIFAHEHESPLTEVIKAISLSHKTLIIIDTLHHILSSNKNTNIPQYLFNLIRQDTSLIAVYHSDQPLSTSATLSPYQPHPRALLKTICTTIMATHSLSNMLALKSARDRSLVPPTFGLSEREEGVLQGLGANDRRAVVVECEVRRKSGRGVEVRFVLDLGESQRQRMEEPKVVLFDDHPLFRKATESEKAGDADSEVGEVSFNLGLTEKQRRDREGVLLPYFDAQRSDGGGGASEGGRILYDMGVEDDFDDEEDEL